MDTQQPSLEDIPEIININQIAAQSPEQRADARDQAGEQRPQVLLDRALALQPNHGATDEAIAINQELSELDPHDPQPPRRLSDLHARQGHLDLAQEALPQAVNLTPDDQGAHKRLDAISALIAQQPTPQTPAPEPDPNPLDIMRAQAHDFATDGIWTEDAIEINQTLVNANPEVLNPQPDNPNASALSNDAADQLAAQGHRQAQARPAQHPSDTPPVQAEAVPTFGIQAVWARVDANPDDAQARREIIGHLKDSDQVDPLPNTPEARAVIKEARDELRAQFQAQITGEMHQARAETDAHIDRLKDQIEAHKRQEPPANAPQREIKAWEDQDQALLDRAAALREEANDQHKQGQFGPRTEGAKEVNRRMKAHHPNLTQTHRNIVKNERRQEHRQAIKLQQDQQQTRNKTRSR